MCYEYEWIEKARAAEQFRKEKQKVDEQKKQVNTANPGKPAEPEKRVKEQEPVPA
jgi:hypothetical protein